MIQVIVDWQNVLKACENRIPLDAIIGEITKRALKYGDIQEIRLFVPNYQSVAPWQILNGLQIKYGLEVSVSPTLREGTRVEVLKDVVDFEVLRFVTKHVHANVGASTIVFVTGDSHFLVAANEARRRSKEVEFWFVDGQNVSGTIRRQENMREIKMTPPVLLSDENPFLTSLAKATNQEPLDDQDYDRIELINRAAKINTKPIGWWLSVEAAFQFLSNEWNVSETDCQQIMEALMVLGIARIYPATTTTVSVDTQSPLFQWLSAFASGRSREEHVHN